MVFRHTAYFQSLAPYFYKQAYRFSWNVDVVAEQLAQLLNAQYLLPEVYIGADARFLFAPLLALPLWLNEPLTRLGVASGGVRRDPAFVEEKGAKKE